MVGGKGCSLFQCLHFTNVVLRNDVYVPHVVLDLPTYVYLHFHHTILVLLQKNMQCVQDLSLDKPVRVEDLITLCQLPDNNSPTKQFYTALRSHMLKMKEHLVISLLIVEGSTCSLKELFTLCQNMDTADVCITCYSCVYCTQSSDVDYLRNSLHKLQICALPRMALYYSLISRGNRPFV